MIGSIDIDLQWGIKPRNFPTLKSCNLWSNIALLDEYNDKNWTVTIRIVDLLESKTLNKSYRNKDYATNILSFPYDFSEFLSDEIEPSMFDGKYYLGDLVVCADLLELESSEQNKSLESHWSHIIIHGILHLQGMNHLKKLDTQKMENLEIKLLTSLGFKNPYL